MSVSTYSLRLRDKVLSHGTGSTGLLGDYASDYDQEIDAMVASGDTFSTIATQLDKLHTTLLDNEHLDCPELQHLVDTLLYLQRYYKITTK